ncbi:hypothetical protein A0H81_12801 [Grifola frondosa]|uniref:Uncharacterized protein n=1 Tax=Grifola frondosa TaxID=5627 RepID=A0A1C7LS82_GRIFR|nr:hypothetical protein A0H81_12801 [Grifola frondosa]
MVQSTTSTIVFVVMTSPLTEIRIRSTPTNSLGEVESPFVSTSCSSTVILSRTQASSSTLNTQMTILFP